MKRFSCGDVVPGCDATFVGEGDDDILAQVGAHAAGVHGLAEVPSELVGAVRASIRG